MVSPLKTGLTESRLPLFNQIEPIELIQSLQTDDVLDFTCGQFETIDSCDRHLDPDLWAKFKKLKTSEELSAERAKQKFFSPVPSMVAVIADYQM